MQGESTGSRKDKKQILFIHGGGDGGYEADETLVAFLQRELGASYTVHSPQMPDDPAPDFGWVSKIASEIAAISGDVLLVGHSLGASMLLKYLSEHDVPRRISGIFLIATPFWNGDEDWQQGLTLRRDFAAALPKGVPVFFYQSEDDEVVDVSQVDIYAEQMPHATVRRSTTGGHQFTDNLAQVVNDIRSLDDFRNPII